jgi:hypothetical protein
MQRLGLEPGTFRLQTVGSTAAPGPLLQKSRILAAWKAACSKAMQDEKIDLPNSIQNFAVNHANQSQAGQGSNSASQTSKRFTKYRCIINTIHQSMHKVNFNYLMKWRPNQPAMVHS